MSTTHEELTPSIAQLATLQEIVPKSEKGNPVLNGRLDLIGEVRVRVEARLGFAELSVGELFKLKENAVLTLESAPTDPVDILLDGKLIARGALVVVGDKLGICIEQIAPEQAV